MKKKTKKQKSSPKLEIGHDMKPSALGKYHSIEAWEDAHGRGFWGSSAHGYTYDKDNR